MCAGAILNARIPTVVYGARDPKAGSLDSVQQMYALPYNHRPEVISGVLEAECSGLLRDFFRELRARRKLDKSGESTLKSPQNVDKTADSGYDNSL